MTIPRFAGIDTLQYDTNRRAGSDIIGVADSPERLLGRHADTGEISDSRWEASFLPAAAAILSSKYQTLVPRSVG
jgi:hypothetical protein